MLVGLVQFGVGLLRCAKLTDVAVRSNGVVALGNGLVRLLPSEAEMRKL